LKFDIDKSTATDITAILFIISSFFTSEPYSKYLLYTGLFAISGAITNQLAIYMLFNRVPLLYGSGVIEENFESFKSSIKKMIMEQFFTKEQIREFFREEKTKLDFAPLVESADFTLAFNALKQSVMESSLGNALNLFGGEKALDRLEEPFKEKLKSAVVKIVNSNAFKTQLDYHIQNSTLSDDLIASIDKIITNRLNSLTPQMVNELVKSLIHTHLGWLVVWGGVFGGLIGFLSAFFI